VPESPVGLECDPSQVVAWAYWYTDGSRWVSISDPHPHTPRNDVQVQRVWWKKPGDPTLYGSWFTRFEYVDPETGEISKGEWTDWQNHDRVCEIARAFEL
jgi:hypothetical protein